MDERTRRTKDEATPGLPPLTAPPVIKSRAGGRMRLVIGLIVLIAAVIGAYFLLRSVFNGQPSGAGRSQSSAAQPVGAATVTTGDIRVVVNALGTVTPIATVTVQTQISGQLQEIGFTEGTLVKQGDFLAQIDPRPYQLQEAQYEGQLAHDQGLLKQAQVDLARYQKLAEQNSIARQQSEDQVYMVQQYQGTVKLDQALIDQQKLNVIYCRILSPVTGGSGAADRPGQLRADHQQQRTRCRHPDAADHRDLPHSRGRPAGHIAAAQVGRRSRSQPTTAPTSTSSRPAASSRWTTRSTPRPAP